MAELTQDNLMKTIEKYGPDGVLEVARDAGFPLTSLIALQEHIDSQPRAPRHRKTAEARVRAWLGLPEEEAAA